MLWISRPVRLRNSAYPDSILQDGIQWRFMVSDSADPFRFRYIQDQPEFTDIVEETVRDARPFLLTELTEPTRMAYVFYVNVDRDTTTGLHNGG